jgi:hypothetical protein
VRQLVKSFNLDGYVATNPVLVFEIKKKMYVLLSGVHRLCAWSLYNESRTIKARILYPVFNDTQLRDLIFFKFIQNHGKTKSLFLEKVNYH